MIDSFSRWLYNLSVMTDVRILKVVGRHAIGLQFLGIQVSSFLGSKLVVPSTSHSGVSDGSCIICEYAFAMGVWRLVNCLIQKLGSLSGPGDFQLLLLLLYVIFMYTSTVRKLYFERISSRQRTKKEVS